MEIDMITVRNLGFCRAPVAHKSNLVRITSIVEDFETKRQSWIGAVMCTLVKLETDGSPVGFATGAWFQ